MAIDAGVKLVELDLKTIQLKLEGISPLIIHRFSEKAKKQMLDKMLGKASKGKAPKDPVAEYEAAYHRLPDGSPGFPVVGIKAAAVTAVTSLGKQFTKVAARQAFHILHDKKGGELGEVHYPHDCPPYMREDMVRVGIEQADMRYRPEFLRWGMIIRVQYNERAISQEVLVNLINLGGFSVGLGEHRPERDGDNGRFQVVSHFSWEKK